MIGLMPMSKTKQSIRLESQHLHFYNSNIRGHCKCLSLKQRVRKNGNFPANKPETLLKLNNEVSQLDQNLSEQAVSLDTTYLDRQIYVLNNVYAQEMKDQITENVVAEVSSNPVVSGWIYKDHVRVITRVYLVGLTSEQIIKKSSTDELASELSFLIKKKNPKFKS